MTNVNSHFSIVIPAKNEAAFIPQTLRSIAQQTCVDSATPIFLCDAHSADATVALAQQVAATYQLNEVSFTFVSLEPSSAICYNGCYELETSPPGFSCFT